MYILQNMKVKEVLIGIQPENSEQLNTLIKIIKEKNIKLSILEADMKIKILENCYIDVLWPIKENLVKENTLNNNSLVFKLYYNNFSILFTVDIEYIAEKVIIKKYAQKLKCNVLKIAHHGSKSSTIQEFLDYTNPQIALIGVGKNNKFGHPNEEVIKRLEKCRSKNL